MHIAFRVDSSTIIGHGHVMRCLTLAHALVHQLKKSTNQCQLDKLKISFFSRNHSGNINQRIIDAGFKLIELPTTNQTIRIDDTNTWLATTCKRDAEDCITQFQSLTSIDLLIIDHYAIEKQWHIITQDYYEKLLVIDDLANRKHFCNYLLDQTFNRNPSDYQAKVPEYCQLLLGQDYILLRDEFLLLKEQAIKRRNAFIESNIDNTTSLLKEKLSLSCNILISMGGSDPKNISQKALLAVEKTRNNSTNITATIVISKRSHFINSLTDYCKNNTWATLIIDSQNMAELMLSADMAIGACGGTAWERCALGLPCLTSVYAKNQQLIANNLSKSGAIKNLGWHENITVNMIKNNIKELLLTPKLYQCMVEACFAICDGKGVERVSNIITHLTQKEDNKLKMNSHDKLPNKSTTSNKQPLASKITLSPATAQDCKLVFKWQSSNGIRKYCTNPKAPSWQEHKHWFYACLADASRILYLMKNEKKYNVGLLRLDKALNNDSVIPHYEISILIAPEYQGKGFAVNALKKLIMLKENAIYLARIDDKNIASLRVFKKVGFNKIFSSHYQLTIIHFKINHDNKYNISNIK
jgi:UDP-2,4-diacetamido-2,4,6-trideoxy-beta-L-altropyranose hydrolase